MFEQASFSPMDMNDQRYFAHPSSVPMNVYRQREQASDQIQPRSYSVSQTPFPGNASQITNQIPQWQTQQDSLPTGSNTAWQPQQRYTPPEGRSQQTNRIHDFISDHVQPVLQYHSSTDAPWHAHGFQQQHMPHRFDGDQFRSLGGSATVSPDTRSQPASFNDSAYYSQDSQHKRSAPSDQVQQDFAGRLLSPNQDFTAPSLIDHKPPRSVASDSKIHKKARRPTPARKFIQCTVSGCNKADLKNKSDLQKHLNQHAKPFLCTEAGCDRADEGFGTVNDLERHRSSVHKLHPRCGTTVGYVCFACEQHRATGKWWPRKDNFKSHIKRRHPGWPMDELVTASSKDTRPPDARSEVQSAVTYQGEHVNSFEHIPSWTQHPPFQHTNYLAPPHGNEGEMLAGGGQWTDSTARQDFPASLRLPNMSNINNAQSHLGSSNSSFGMSTAESLNAPTIPATPTLRLSVPTRNMQPQELETLGWDQRTASAHSQSSSSQGLPQSNGWHMCTTCGKVTERACDLRKHEKRHTRPYGCTYPRCVRRFGSRNDWKRHEKKQHSLVEQWRCQLPSSEGPACGKLFDKREDMSAHLDSRHGNEGYHHDNPLHCSAIDAFHIGKEHYQSFWCGFCDNLISRKKDGHQYNVDIRVQHVGDHFDKDRRSIDDWIDLEENKQKRHIASPTSQAHTMRDSSSDVSDGGDDGIAGPSSLVPINTRVTGRTTRFGAGANLWRQPYSTNRRLNVDDDAEGESDHEYSQSVM